MPGIKIKLSGFDELLEKIQKVNGNVDKAAETCARAAAAETQKHLISEMQAAAVPQQLISAMPPPEIKKEGNEIVAHVGYKKGKYDPNNLSDAYKVLFLNYGTPNRKKHGKVRARGFIGKAKKGAAKSVRKIQKETLTKILKGLQK